MDTLDLRTLLIGRVNTCHLRDGRSSRVVIDTWFEDPQTAQSYIVCRALEGGTIPIGMLIFFRLEVVGIRVHFIGLADEEYRRAQLIWIGVLHRLHRREQELAAAVGY